MSAGGPDHALDLRTRLGGLQLVRLALGAVALGAVVLAPGQVRMAPASLSALVCAYVAGTSAVELARRAWRLRLARLTGGLVVVDCAFVAAVSIFDAGPGSPLMVLASIHVIAVVLLVSAGSGLRAAGLYTALLYAGAVSGATAARPHPPGAYALAAVGVLLVAAATAGITALGDREATLQRRRIGALAELGSRAARSLAAGEVEALLVDSVVSAAGFRRGAVVREPPAPCGDASCALVRRLDDRFGDLADHLPGAENVVVVPLVVDGERLGWAGFEAGAGARGLPGGLLDTVERMAAHTALVLRNAELRAQVEEMATTDSLTGLPNRRRFETELQGALARWERQQEPFALLALDIDRFKAVNDTYGHATGDEVLRHVGRVLRDQCRAVDLAARTGGEEFWVILTACQLAEAEAMAERLRAAIARSGGPLPVTVSIGVATLPGATSDVDRLQDVADAALYRAKEDGRNRVRVAPELWPARRPAARAAQRRTSPLRAGAANGYGGGVKPMSEAASK